MHVFFKKVTNCKGNKWRYEPLTKLALDELHVVLSSVSQGFEIAAIILVYFAFWKKGLHIICDRYKEIRSSKIYKSLQKRSTILRGEKFLVLTKKFGIQQKLNILNL